MIKLNVCVMNLLTGSETWVSLPAENLKALLDGADPDDVVIEDYDDVPFSMSSDPYKANEALLACIDAGIDDPGALAAICDVCEIPFVDDDDLVALLGIGDVSVFSVDRKWADMTPREKAARYLAIEKYIPFGKLKASDLVLVEDELLDFIDWVEVWDDYRMKGFSFSEIDGTTYVVEV